MPDIDPASPALRVLPDRGEFDEEGYLQLYPDIALGVSRGTIESGWAHFSRCGFAEGRAWLPQPDPGAGVSRAIAPSDEMHTDNPTHYFDVGASALHCLEAALFTTRRNRSSLRRILDLPCGHGRVMRFLRRAFPAAELTACDLNRDGVDFCARTFGAVPVTSSIDPAAIPLAPGFDLIWCGSLLTHLPEAHGAAFLDRFRHVLQPGGLVVFTTHGRRCAQELRSRSHRHGLTLEQGEEVVVAFRQAGIGYVDYPGQTGYGFNLVQPAYLIGHHLQHPGWRLVSYHEAGWDRRQDVVCLQKRHVDEGC